MRVLQVGLSYNPGGIESFVMNYYRQLAKQGVQFDFISMFPELAYEQEIKMLGGKVFHTVDARRYPFHFRKQLLKILNKRHYDAVHVNMLSAANILPLVVAKEAGVQKIIAHSHNSSTVGAVRNILHRANKRLIPRYATDYFACSKVAGEWLFSKKTMKSPNFHIIHNALNLEEFLFSEKERNEIRTELGIGNQYVIGHIGRFEEQKNHIFLIEIFREVAKIREDVELLLIGDGELLKEIQEKVENYGLKEKVQFLGIRNDVRRLWKAMDLFLFPSLYEGLPIVALEAQASGVYGIMSSAITKEVQITDRIEFVSLEKSASEWKEQIVKYMDYERSEEYNETIQLQFRNHGYDIINEAEKLRKYYSE